MTKEERKRLETLLRMYEQKLKTEKKPARICQAHKDIDKIRERLKNG